MPIKTQFSGRFYPQRFFSLGDALVLLVIATTIFGVVSTGHQWSAAFHPATEIDLSISALPKYTLLSAARGFIAYFFSLSFTLVVGYVGAKSRLGERLILPALDILQTIPVLGFLPGLVLGLISLFPNTNAGLELAAILMMVTSQVWNMTFSFYSSIKSIPEEINEAATMMGLGWFQRLLRLELPFSAVNLAWNSLLSMAGGWFFLTVCEAFTLGSREFRLPGIGSYMAVAIAEGNRSAMAMGVVAMTLLIVTMDFVIWRPILAWAQRYRVEDVPGAVPTEPLVQIVIRDSRIVRFLKLQLRDRQARKRQRILEREKAEGIGFLNKPLEVFASPQARQFYRSKWLGRVAVFFALTALGVVLGWGGVRLFELLSTLSASEWVILGRNAFWTWVRVMLAVVLSTVWAVPVGIWIGTSSRRIRVAQPVIQVLASFPAPMLFPIALFAILRLGFNFDVASVAMMLLGVQWYVLFNSLAGALRIPAELDFALRLMEVPRWERWRTLYLPCVFPSLVTGWVMATGAAWNTSIVAEYMVFKGKLYQTGGLGATLTVAASNADFRMLAASLTIMVAVVIAFNRFVWAPIYREAQTRYRMDA
ncbi:MAG: ABC transporter permease subunit [Oligoflexia bacterium]|nr:ABC transporter permease subunit [Oligoflexia bacterium]